MFQPDFDYFQDVQNVYSTLTNLQCLITDKIGNPVTKVLEKHNLFELISGQDGVSQMLSHWTSYFSKLSSTILFDVETLPGVKLIVSPIKLQNGIEYFIFAGCIVENSSKDAVKSYLEETVILSKNATTIFPLLNECTHKEIQDRLEKIKKFTDILTEWLSSQDTKHFLNDKKKNVNETLRLVNSENVSVADLLRHFFDTHSKIDFVGYARKNTDDYFMIDECLDNVENTLKGSVFSMGEGILGQAATTQSVRFWNQFNIDPRNSFFHQRGIFPKSVFCYPIVQGNEVIGLFFGGSSEVSQIEKEVSFEGQLITSYIKSLENKSYWERKANNHLMKMTALNEIFQVMMTVQDVKKILFIMLDMSINLILGKFASVIVQHPERKSFDIVSRGLNGDQMEDYFNDLTSRNFQNNQDDSFSFEPTEHITSWGIPVIEFPIYYKSEGFGFLSISLDHTVLKPEDKSFLKSLTIAGGLAIHQLELLNKVEIEQQITQLLIDLQKYIDPSHFKQATRAREIIKGFSEYTSFENFNTLDLKYSLYFMGYEEQFLLDKMNNSHISNIVREYKLVEEGIKDLANASLDVQLLTFVWSYLDEKENLQSLSKFSKFNVQLVNELTSYLSRFNVIEREIVLSNHYTPFEPKINKSLNLTKREQDVVKLVLQGNNNREIAQNLFISEHTVKNHMTNIFNKLEVNDRAQVIAKIYQSGFHPKDVS